MAIYHTISTENRHTSTGNAGTVADPMGLQEAFDAVAAGDEIRIMADADYLIDQTITIGTTGTQANPIKVVGADTSGVVDGSRPHINGRNGSGSQFQVFTVSGAIGYYHFNTLKVNAKFDHCFRQISDSIFDNITADLDRTRTLIRECNRPLVIDCHKTGGSGYYLFTKSSNAKNATLINCTATSCEGVFDEGDGFQGGDIIHGCEAINCVLGFRIKMSGEFGFSITDCIARGCSSHGFWFDNKSIGGRITAGIVARCISHDNDGSGFHITNAATTAQNTLIFADLIATNNAAWGFENLSAVSRVLCRGLHGRSNTSGLSTGTLLGAAPVALTADPFIDASTGNFLINDTAGGGAVLRAVRHAITNGFAGPYPFRSLVGTLGGGSPPTPAHWG